MRKSKNRSSCDVMCSEQAAVTHCGHMRALINQSLAHVGACLLHIVMAFFFFFFLHF